MPEGKKKDQSHSKGEKLFAQTHWHLAAKMSALDLVEPPNLSRQRFTSAGKSKSYRGSRKSRRIETEANEKRLDTSPIRASKKVEARKLKSGETKKNHLSQGIKTSTHLAPPMGGGKLPQQVEYPKHALHASDAML